MVSLPGLPAPIRHSAGNNVACCAVEELVAATGSTDCREQCEQAEQFEQQALGKDQKAGAAAGFRTADRFPARGAAHRMLVHFEHGMFLTLGQGFRAGGPIPGPAAGLVPEMAAGLGRATAADLLRVECPRSQSVTQTTGIGFAVQEVSQPAGGV